MPLGCSVSFLYLALGLLHSGMFSLVFWHLLLNTIIAIILRLGLFWKSFILVLSCQFFAPEHTVPVARC